MALPLKTRKGTLFLGDGNTAAAARRVLLSELVNMAYSEAMARGDASDIDTPAFREGLLRSVRLQGPQQKAGGQRQEWPPLCPDRRQRPVLFGQAPATRS